MDAGIRLEKLYKTYGMIGGSPPMQILYEMIGKVAASAATVLIVGETGTGKDLVARAIHRHSDRKDKRFVSVNCAAIPDGLLESELFGHKKGAFTTANYDKKGLLEAAYGGTVFLNEIGNIPPYLQAKILDALQDREVRPVGDTENKQINVRFISATSRDLEDMVSDGTFREDLFYRLNTIPIYIAPLRERAEDIPLLIAHFLNMYCEIDKKFVALSPEAIDYLSGLPYPGNVRQLENLVERAVVIEGIPRSSNGQQKILGQSDIERLLRYGSNGDSAGVKPLLTLKDVENQYILKVLKDCEGHRRRTAETLGISERRLYILLTRIRKEVADADTLI
ncbi:MAG: sigma-54 dependent transcriptional regulator [Nanoarchaeota archaeon]